MRIAIVNWPINDVGGINTWISNIHLGLTYLGHEVRIYHCTPQLRYECHPTEPIRKRRFCILPGDHLSYRDEDLLGQTIDTLNSYDIVIFGHTSPHPTASQLNKPNSAGWMRIYSMVTAKKVVVFHDAKWRKTNEWFSDVRGQVDLAVAAQRHFMPSLRDWADGRCKTIWEYFPMPTVSPPPLIQPEERSGRGIIFTQWIKWKNHRKFLPFLEKIITGFDLYGGGIEYHYAQSYGEMEFIRDTTANYGPEDARHVYHGFVPNNECMEALSRAHLAMDLSYRGYTNMSHWEPLWHGTPSFVEERVLDDQFCMLPRELCESYRLDESVVRRVDDFVLDPRKLAEAQSWVADKCAPHKVASRILEHL